MDTKERILKAAYEEFAANGYSKSSLGAIADAIGITRPALYYTISRRKTSSWPYTTVLTHLPMSISRKSYAVPIRFPTTGSYRIQFMK